MPNAGRKDMPQGHAEKVHHTQNLNDVLSDALDKWKQGDPTTFIVQFEVSVSPNPGGVSQYRCKLVPAPASP